MGLDESQLREQCSRTLTETNFPQLGERIPGKVRDSYVAGGRRVLIATDRISCFDVVVGTIPFKGQVLNQMAAFWFEQIAEVAPHHLLEVPDPAVSIARECRPLPVEFVYRGYLTGTSKTSILRAYEAGEREYCGHRLPDGLARHQKLPTPLLTPTTKAEQGAHDELASRESLIASGAISAELYDRAAEIAARVFEVGSRHAAGRGLILVDTKYEMGLDPDRAGDANAGIVLIDEVHTPDSSRYWYADRYDQAMRTDRDPVALDKEYVRRWLVEQGWQGDGPSPTLPDEVRCEAARRYIEAFERISGRAFEPDTDEPTARIARNLGL